MDEPTELRIAAEKLASQASPALRKMHEARDATAAAIEILAGAKSALAEVRRDPSSTDEAIMAAAQAFRKAEASVQEKVEQELAAIEAVYAGEGR